MKKVLFIAVCIVSVCAFTSCGSTAPCGLSQKANQNQVDYHQADIIVAEAITE